jgi:hypothetical protein
MVDVKKLEDNVEFLSEQVHNAWWEEKKRQGFHSPSECENYKLAAVAAERFGSGNIGEDAKFTKYCPKCHTDMYPYEELTENIKEYDRVTVRNVLDAVNYFDDKTCKDCEYLDLKERTCFWNDIDESVCNQICESFRARGI